MLEVVDIVTEELELEEEPMAMVVVEVALVGKEADVERLVVVQLHPFSEPMSSQFTPQGDPRIKEVSHLKSKL